MDEEGDRAAHDALYRSHSAASLGIASYQAFIQPTDRRQYCLTEVHGSEFLDGIFANDDKLWR